MLDKKFTKLAMLIAASVISASSYAWRVDLNFDGGAVGKVAQGTSGFSDAASAAKYTTDQVYAGGGAIETSIKAGENGFGSFGGIITHPTVLKKGDQVWFRVCTFMPVGFNYDSNGEGNHLKFMRIHTQNTAGSNEGYNDWYINPKGSKTAHLFIFEGEQVWDEFASSAYAPVLGKWEVYEMYVKLDNVAVDNGGTGRVRVWKNGVLLKDITSRKTLLTASSVSDRTHLFTYWNGGAPQSEKMYVDDIVLTSDTPSAKDAQGNPYIGVGSGAAAVVSPPMAPKISVDVE